MTRNEALSTFKINDLLNLPTRIREILFGERAYRDELYRDLIRMHGGDMTFDWFQQVYEDELSERKNKGQDFTPKEVSELECKLVGGNGGIIHEPTAGTGGLIIQYWWGIAKKSVPWDFKPSSCIFSCWELSDRSIPILLLNLSIRGIMGEVFHGDVLENKAVDRYVLINEKDDPMAFSDIIVDNSVKGYKVGHSNTLF